MILGVDLDNTLCCYDGLFHAAALAQGLLGAETPPGKRAVRDALRAQGREADWTRLQGTIYGPGMVQAKPYPGAAGCLKRLIDQGDRVCIVSHRTRYPHLGPRYDLHAAALDWLRRQGFFGQDMLDREAIFLEESAEDKVARIAALGCSHFVDDLPQILDHPGFPRHVRRILFGGVPQGGRLQFSSWPELDLFLQREKT